MLLAPRHWTTLVQTAAELGTIRARLSLPGAEQGVSAPHPAPHRSWFVCRGVPFPLKLIPSLSAQPGRCWWPVSQWYLQASLCLLPPFECVNVKVEGCVIQYFWQPNLFALAPKRTLVNTFFLLLLMPSSHILCHCITSILQRTSWVRHLGNNNVFYW